MICKFEMSENNSQTEMIWINSKFNNLPDRDKLPILSFLESWVVGEKLKLQTTGLPQNLKPCSPCCQGHVSHQCEKCGQQWIQQLRTL